MDDLFKVIGIPFRCLHFQRMSNHYWIFAKKTCRSRNVSDAIKSPFWNLICDVRASARAMNILLSSVHDNWWWFIFNRFHSEMVWIFDTEHTKLCDIKVFVSHFRIFLSFPCSIDCILPACQYLTAVSHCLFHSKNTFLGNMFDFKICLCLRSRYFYLAG